MFQKLQTNCESQSSRMFNVSMLWEKADFKVFMPQVTPILKRFLLDKALSHAASHPDRPAVLCIDGNMKLSRKVCSDKSCILFTSDFGDTVYGCDANPVRGKRKCRRHSTSECIEHNAMAVTTEDGAQNFWERRKSLRSFNNLFRVERIVDDRVTKVNVSPNAALTNVVCQLVCMH